MEKRAFEEMAKGILERADMLCLGTRGKEPYPYLRALFNLRNKAQFPGLAGFFADKGLALYLGTNSSSLKMAQLGAEEWVSLYYMIPGEFLGLCLSGRARSVPEARAELWVEGWERYYPAGPGDPDYSVLRVEPERARGWCGARPFDLAL
ncbi:MAG TPA: pyridoxamine 5'-phosphate oxidase family protein [Spirochaetia bacterium]|nr:pyridoxamine 5'-phosphate oxidase family protein [Spirochaetia bacterium]HRZ66057.1 pyridoxamine 5'-phosphate oxidase family protein [Spirochaetia bacterium]